MDQNKKIKNKIAITGANGFLGSNICDLFNKKDLKIKRLYRFSNSKNNSDYYFDLKKPFLEDGVLNDVSCLIHCAATVHKKNINEQHYRKVDFLGTINLIKSAINSKVNHIIFISTLSVYGLDYSKTPIDDDTLLLPNTPYGKIKLKTESEVIRLCNLSNTKYTIIRFPILYGYKCPGNFSLMQKISSFNIPLPFKSVNNTRSMAYIGNVVDFIFYVYVNKVCIDKILLFSDNSNFSIEYLLTNIRKYNKKKRRLFYLPKLLMKFLLSIIGKQKIYFQLYEDLKIIPSKEILESGWKPKFNKEDALFNMYKN